MIITFSKQFKKEYGKFSQKTQGQISKRIKIFTKNQNHPQLNSHKLHGKYVGYFSINISGNIRAIYEFLDKKTVLFIKVGTHTQLY